MQNGGGDGVGMGDGGWSGDGGWRRGGGGGEIEWEWGEWGGWGGDGVEWSGNGVGEE